MSYLNLASCCAAAVGVADTSRADDEQEALVGTSGQQSVGSDMEDELDRVTQRPSHGAALSEDARIVFA